MKILIILMGLFAIGYGFVHWSATPALRRYIGTPFVISFVLLTVAGTYAPNAAIFLAICVVVMLATTRDPLDTLCRYVLLVAMVPFVTMHATLGATYIAQINTPIALGIGCMLAMLVRSGRGRGKPLRGITAEDGVVVLFFLTLGIGSTRFASGTELLRQIITEGLGTLLPYYIFRRHVRSAEELRLVIACVAVASILLSVYAIYEARMGWTVFGSIRANLAERTYMSMNRITRGDSLRASATMSGPLLLACYLSLGWVAAACSQSLLKTRRIWIAWLGLIALGVVMAQSRGNTVCIVAAVVLLAAVRGKAAMAAGFAAAAACAAGLVLLFARSSTFLSGFLNLNTEPEANGVYDYRQLLLQRGLEEAAKHRWTGASMQAVLSQLEDITQGQKIIDFVNTYLVIYLVSGLAGLVPLVVLIGLILRAILPRVKKGAGGDLEIVRAFGIVAFCIFFGQLSFCSFIDRLPFWLGLVMAGTRLVGFERKRAARRDGGATSPRIGGGGGKPARVATPPLRS